MDGDVDFLLIRVDFLALLASPVLPPLGKLGQGCGAVRFVGQRIAKAWPCCVGCGKNGAAHPRNFLWPSRYQSATISVCRASGFVCFKPSTSSPLSHLYKEEAPRGGTRYSLIYRSYLLREQRTNQQRRKGRRAARRASEHRLDRFYSRAWPAMAAFFAN
ncbi:hypothetical protein KCU93_g336, partial [Aureobasidium melanogenum]